MKRALASTVLASLVLALALLPPAQACDCLSGGERVTRTVTTEGTFLLTPSGSLNDTYHAYLESVGFRGNDGDRLEFAWYTDDESPVRFEIHAKPTEATWTPLYEATRSADSGAWIAPATDRYLVMWQNPGPGEITVSYVLKAQLPKPDYSGFVLASWAFFGLLAAVLVWKMKALFRPPEAPKVGHKPD